MIRRYGEPVGRRGYVTRPGAYAVLPAGDAVLLTFQAAPRPEFQLPGGGIDAGEGPIGALHREVREETGWSLARPRRLGAFRRFTYMPEYGIWAEKICHVFLAAPTRRTAAPSEPGHTAVWLPFDEAVRAVANDGDRAFLREARRRVRRTR